MPVKRLKSSSDFLDDPVVMSIGKARQQGYRRSAETISKIDEIAKDLTKFAESLWGAEHHKKTGDSCKECRLLALMWSKKPSELLREWLVSPDAEQPEEDTE